MNHGKLTVELATGLQALRGQIAKAQIPASKLDENIKIATWNIREFGRKRRSSNAIHYIAEMLGQFDLIAITELQIRLTDLERVMKVLGPYWKVVYSDFIPDPGGNRERFAYLYDARVVLFTGLAAEADAPRKKNRATGEYLPTITWWRAPYMASFRAGTFDFVIITAHIRWGSGAAQRLKPLKELAKWVDKLARRKDLKRKDLLVMGDFNIPSADPTDELFSAITSKGLRIAPGLEDVEATTLSSGKRYDQILHYPSVHSHFTGNGGTVDFYGARGSVAKKLFEGMEKNKFTYQMSDHLPLWVELDIDTSDREIEQVLGES